MQIPNDYREIVNMLAEKTESGKVHWRKEKFDISVAIEKSRFSIWAGNDEHTERGFVAFALQDSKGATVDSWFVEEGDDDYPLMQRFHGAAKRHALGVPAKLRQLAESISNASEIGDSDEI
jgi:hypothetical protein